MASEKQEIWKSILDDLQEVIPKRCPNCGEPLVPLSDNGKFWIMPMTTTPDVKKSVTTFDVYCGECEWSGEISPDALDAYNDMRKQMREKEVG